MLLMHQLRWGHPRLRRQACVLIDGNTATETSLHVS